MGFTKMCGELNNPAARFIVAQQSSIYLVLNDAPRLERIYNMGERKRLRFVCYPWQ